MYLEHRLSALLQLHLHSRLNTWLQWNGQRQLQGKTGNISVLGFGASYIRCFAVVYWAIYVSPGLFDLCVFAHLIGKVYSITDRFVWQQMYTNCDGTMLRNHSSRIGAQQYDVDDRRSQSNGIWLMSASNVTTDLIMVHECIARDNEYKCGYATGHCQKQWGQ